MTTAGSEKKARRSKHDRTTLINQVWVKSIQLQKFATTDMLLQFPDASDSTIKSILTLLRHKGILVKKGKGPWRLSDQLSRIAAIQLANYLLNQTETQWRRDETTKISGATIDPDTWWLWA